MDTFFVYLFSSAQKCEIWLNAGRLVMRHQIVSSHGRQRDFRRDSREVAWKNRSQMHYYEFFLLTA
jgi:hypothetical protein